MMAITSHTVTLTLCAAITENVTPLTVTTGATVAVAVAVAVELVMRSVL